MDNNHVYSRKQVETMLSDCKNKTLGEIDNKFLFESIKGKKFQKGIIGKVIEECVFNYESNSEQKADLIIDGTNTELKSTGLLNVDNELKAKENVSITAVSIDNIPYETFKSSHFWEKIEHLLFVFYEYVYKEDGSKPSSYEYRKFKILGHYFNELNNDEINGLKEDWEKVYTVVSEIYHSCEDCLNEKEHKRKIKSEYIRRRHEIKEKGLSFFDLAPKYPPRFRLKSAFINYIVGKWLNNNYETIPNAVRLDDLNHKCEELQRKYYNKSLIEIATDLNINIDGNGSKNIAEGIIAKMFTGKKCKLNNIELFAKYGVIAKTCTYNSKNTLTEDTKLFKMNFSDINLKKVEDIDEIDKTIVRKYEFEDSKLYKYFSESIFLFIIFKRPESIKIENEKVRQPIKNNVFLGFKLVRVDDNFINSDVKKLWDDTRNKVNNKKLKLITIKRNKKNCQSPNFMKSKDNSVFIRGGAQNSSQKNKKERINGIDMLPQFVWLKKSKVKEFIEKK